MGEVKDSRFALLVPIPLIFLLIVSGLARMTTENKKLNLPQNSPLMYLISDLRGD
jgi:hypothetical protein